MALIKCDGISIAYEGQTVVRDLSFWIEQGDYLCIVGENGSGKSTLVKSLLGLKPPFKGQILLGDGLKQDEIGYLPQQTVVQKDFPASVREIVLSGCQGRCGLRPFYNTQEKELAEDAMERMQITDLARRCYRELSGGQQQRLCIARALAVSPEVLLMDEPTSALDPISTLKVEELMEELKKKYTVVVVTHNMQQAARVSDDTAFFLVGEVIEKDSTDNIFSQPKDKRTEDYITGRFG